MILQNIGRNSRANLQIVPNSQAIKCCNTSARPPNIWFALMIRALIALTILPALAAAANAQVSAPDFRVIVLPDPQNATQNFPQVLNSQVQWVVNNQKALNIQMVLSEGDNVNDGASTPQLQNLDAAFRLLDNAGIPYLLPIGNHDYNALTPRSAAISQASINGLVPGVTPARPISRATFPPEATQTCTACLPSMDSNTCSWGLSTGQQVHLWTGPSPSLREIRTKK